MHKDSTLRTFLYRLSMLIPDSLFNRIKYYHSLKEWPNLKNPTTFNEKLLWLKIHDRNPLHTELVDKYLVKKYVAERVGEQYIIPTLGVWDKAEDIDFDSLPEQFVMKCCHDSGRVIICRDKSKLDKNWARKEMEYSLKRNFYVITREWPYKNVKRRIIAEKYMKDNEYDELRDFKFFCFGGEPKLCQVISDRSSGEKIDFYDMDWNRLEGVVGLNPCVGNSEYNHPIPKTFDKMKEIARVLSQGMIFTRIDLYEVNGKCYFGEITFFPASVTGSFRPIEWNKIIGDWVKLPK